MLNQKIGEILIEHALISREQLDFCLNIQTCSKGLRLGTLLISYQFINEEAFTRALSHQMKYPFFNDQFICDENLLEKLGVDYCSEHLVYPLKTNDSQACVLASPTDVLLIDQIYKKTGEKVDVYVGIERIISNALKDLSQRFLKRIEINQSMLDCVDQLINRALDLHASDIHIEPSAYAVEIRYRINGLLKFQESFPKELLPKLVNVIFHKAEVTVSDFYHFHDARFSYQLSNRTINIRVSHVPCIHGSGVVLRILERDKTAYDLTELGYSHAHWKEIEASLIKPDGITLIVGPTGCGKTTTLYAMLNKIKSLNKKIITIEDPVEIHLSLMTQVQIHEERGIAFAESIRALLRHDPDVLLIGEIRDQETAKQAMRAAMTGHKVFATLHTTKAVDAIFRMIDLGVEPFLLAQSLNMVIAQRLVRKLCGNCKESKAYARLDCASYVQKYFDSELQNFYTAKGCDECHYTGYKDRSVVAEVLTVNPVIQEAIAKKDWGQFYHDLRQQESFISFSTDAHRLLHEGKTSISEIVRVLG